MMIRINLLPPEYRVKPSIVPLRLLLLLILVVAPLAMGGAASYCYLDIQALTHSVEEIREERAQYEALYQKAVGMEATLARVQDDLAAHDRLAAGHLEAVEILRAFEEVVPENAIVSSLTVGEGGNLNFSGTATSYYGVAAFNLKLNLSDHFTPSPFGSTGGSGDKYSFSFTTSYRAGGGEAH